MPKWDADEETETWTEIVDSNDNENGDGDVDGERRWVSIRAILRKLTNYPYAHLIVTAILIVGSFCLEYTSVSFRLDLLAVVATSVGVFWIVAALYLSVITVGPTRSTVVWMLYILGVALLMVGVQAHDRQLRFLIQMLVILKIAMLYIGYVITLNELNRGDHLPLRHELNQVIRRYRSFFTKLKSKFFST